MDNTYQITVLYSPDNNPDMTIGEFIADATSQGLVVTDTRLDLEYDETSVTLRGTKDQFLAYFNVISEGDWGSDVDEFMDTLHPVTA
jgi:hypothetical protein